MSDAWAAYFESTKVEDISTYHADGWKTCEDIAREWDVIPDNARKILDRDTKLDKLNVRVRHKGGIRAINVYRPKAYIFPIKP